jgi:hypothetical protein
MCLLAPESLLNSVVVKAVDYTPGLMLKILHFPHSVYSRPLIHPFSWSWISYTRFLGWTFLQVLHQWTRYPKSPVSTCHLWQEFELLSYSFSLNFITTFLQNKICLWNDELYLLLLNRECGGAVFYDTILVFVFTESQNIFSILILITFYFFAMKLVSKVTRNLKWIQVWDKC